MNSKSERDFAAMRMHTPASSVRVVQAKIENFRYRATVRVGCHHLQSHGLGLARLGLHPVVTQAFSAMSHKSAHNA